MIKRGIFSPNIFMLSTAVKVIASLSEKKHVGS